LYQAVENPTTAILGGSLPAVSEWGDLAEAKTFKSCIAFLRASRSAALSWQPFRHD
jgi:hypothetical protein